MKKKASKIVFAAATEIKKRYHQEMKTPQRQTTTSTTTTISTTVRIIKQLQLQQLQKGLSQSFYLILFYSSIR